MAFSENFNLKMSKLIFFTSSFCFDNFEAFHFEKITAKSFNCSVLFHFNLCPIKMLFCILGFMLFYIDKIISVTEMLG